MISHAVISAFLARMSDPEPVLAAYSIAFYFHATIGSPIWACQFVAVSFIRDRASMYRLLLFSLHVAGVISLLMLAVGLTPFGGSGSSGPCSGPARRSRRRPSAAPSSSPS